MCPVIWEQQWTILRVRRYKFLKNVFFTTPYCLQLYFCLTSLGKQSGNYALRRQSINWVPFGACKSFHHFKSTRTANKKQEEIIRDLELEEYDDPEDPSEEEFSDGSSANDHGSLPLYFTVEDLVDSLDLLPEEHLDVPGDRIQSFCANVCSGLTQ